MTTTPGLGDALLALDVDGTLLRSDGSISQRTASVSVPAPPVPPLPASSSSLEQPKTTATLDNATTKDRPKIFMLQLPRKL